MGRGTRNRPKGRHPGKSNRENGFVTGYASYTMCRKDVWGYFLLRINQYAEKGWESDRQDEADAL